MGGNRHAELVSELTRLAGEAADRSGLELVELSVRGSSSKRVIRVDIDRPGPAGVGLADCQQVSQAFGAALDESALLDSRYVLEVSSPGLDRPIRTADDVRRNEGRRVVITTVAPVEGRNRFQGVLLASQNGCLRVADDDAGELSIPLEQIAKASQEVQC